MVSESIRKLIIEGYKKSYRVSYLAETYNVNENTIKSIIKRFNEFGDVIRPRGKKHKKLNQQQIEKVREYVDEDCTRTLDDIKDFIHEKFQIEISVPTVHRYLNEIHYSFKRLTPVPVRRNNDETIMKRYSYAIEFFELDSTSRDKIFFIDEAGIGIHIKVNYGRSKKGTRANLPVKAIKGKNYSVCAAMSIKGLEFYEVKPTSYNSVDFLDYMKEFIAHLKSKKIEKANLIMDNFNSKEKEGESEGKRLYSPFLNPIENLFNQLKFYVKKYRPANAEQVFEGVELASEMITSEDCKNYYNHMKKYIPDCIGKKHINN
ncbi:uncharacterized protein LOC128389229 [Panonychus citri]|uniref:uncharacterized protein LOC128389229 n=1 Tax=Panonychus citri TaxID=50023 RepID=UPI002306F9A0|nr:uncharacterized protein LOC128389229 [Panonychus citri]